MKKLLMLLTVMGVLLFACKKNADLPASAVASLSFVNATIGSAPLATRFNDQTIIFSSLSAANKINYGASNLFSPIAGTNSISFIQATDTTHSLFAGTLNLQTNGVYSLYLTGTTAQPDTLFFQEQLPVYKVTDSVAGIRFVNLSPGSTPVSVNIKGQTNGSEVSSLSYKGRTAFKAYQADHNIASYIFEFRNASSGALLATYTLSGVNNSTGTNTVANTVRFHNLTIALIGQPAGGTVAQSAMLIPNY